jgi:hypothetical protein
MTTMLRKIFSRLGIWRHPPQKASVLADAKHVVVTTGTVVCIADGPKGVYAIVRLHDPKNHKATFSVDTNDENVKAAWQHGHPPHVHQKVKLYGLQKDTRKKKRWFAHKAERY